MKKWLSLFMPLLLLVLLIGCSSEESADTPAVEEEPATVDLVLENRGDDKIGVMRVIQENTEIPLLDINEIVDNTPATILEDITPEEAERLKQLIEEAGGTVQIQ